MRGTPEQGRIKHLEMLSIRRSYDARNAAALARQADQTGRSSSSVPQEPNGGGGGGAYVAVGAVPAASGLPTTEGATPGAAGIPVFRINESGDYVQVSEAALVFNPYPDASYDDRVLVVHATGTGAFILSAESCRPFSGG